MTTLITYEILTGLCQETGQQFHLVVFRDQEGAVLKAQLRYRFNADDDWSEPSKLTHQPPIDPLHPSVA
jgi:hypothetical protein